MEINTNEVYTDQDINKLAKELKHYLKSGNGQRAIMIRWGELSGMDKMFNRGKMKTASGKLIVVHDHNHTEYKLKSVVKQDGLQGNIEFDILAHLDELKDNFIKITIQQPIGGKQ